MLGGETVAGRWMETLAQLRHLPRAVALCWRAAPRFTAAWIALLLAQGLLPAAAVQATRRLVDAVVAGAEPASVALWVGVAAGLLLATELLRGAVTFVRTAQAERIRDHLAGILQERSAAADLAFYETPEQFDRLHRAREEARYRPVAVLESLGGLLQNGITLGAMAVVLLPFGAFVPAALVLSTLPALWVALSASARIHAWRRLRTADERRALYLDGLLSSASSAAEVRLFELGEPLRARFSEVRERLREERVRLARRQVFAESAAGAFGVAVSAAVFLLVALRAARGAVTLGETALFWQAFYSGQRLMRSLLTDLGQIYGSALFLGDLFEFLGLSPSIVSPAKPVPPPGRAAPTVAFHGVSFRYPGAPRDALSGLDLELPAGKITAVVGENGSGKSTLVKLLCRLYDPDAGSVTVDGADLRTLALPDLRRRIAALFQDPVHYFFTAGENVAFGDLAAAPTPERIAAAARSAGAEELVASLPDGYGTPLGKLFAGGVELSGGQWQRVALARALLKPAPILVLDEPTSAMDPWAEEAWVGRLREIARGRTVLLITNRLSTARAADVTRVLRAGRLE